MQRADDGAATDEAQSRLANAGLKGMITVGRPFLEYVVSALADAGITDVCLIIGPAHTVVRDHFASARLDRVRVSFAEQERPLGTADAVLSAESFANGEHVLVVNSDNYYPVHTLRALRELGAAGLAAFERQSLVRLGNIGPDRVAQFSVVRIADDGTLERIVEKPDAATVASFGSEVFVGMNSWSLPPAIFEACRRVRPSARGELELPDAVQLARDDLGVSFKVLRFHDAVLDLSTRKDLATVARRLSGVEPRL